MHVNKATLQTMAIAAAMVVAGTALAGIRGHGCRVHLTGV